ncbi:MAG: hypothetical protein LBT25_02205 [Candidatus Symbiothrix sp.]|jgi:hypothetical protein|nr:hypothetical protein [Candidatus Symbiothrix sp.]
MPKAVAKYNLSGELVAIYASVKEAAEQNHMSCVTLHRLLCKNTPSREGYIWQAAESPDAIPQNISPIPAIPVKPVINTNLRKKLGLTKLKYPCEDIYLLDLEGEIWKPIPDYEVYYMVSNMGRIKRLERWVYFYDGRKYFLEEKIERQFFEDRYSKQGKPSLTTLLFHFNVDYIQFGFIVARAVYSAFVKKLKRGKGKMLYVLHKDLDPFNNCVENLYLATGKELNKRNRQEGLSNLDAFVKELEKVFERKRKPVSQYSLHGEFINSYSSITGANKATGVCGSGIIMSAKGKAYHAGGYLWRYGTDTNNLDTERPTPIENMDFS